MKTVGDKIHPLNIVGVRAPGFTPECWLYSKSATGYWSHCICNDISIKGFE